MPYITKEAGERLKKEMHPTSVGELNYFFYIQFVELFEKNRKYMTIHNILAQKSTFIREYYAHATGISWSNRDMEAAFDLAFQEFYIRHGRPYEDEAIKKNGDIILEKKKNNKYVVVRRSIK